MKAAPLKDTKCTVEDAIQSVAVAATVEEKNVLQKGIDKEEDLKMAGPPAATGKMGRMPQTDGDKNDEGAITNINSGEPLSLPPLQGTTAPMPPAASASATAADQARPGAYYGGGGSTTSRVASISFSHVGVVSGRTVEDEAENAEQQQLQSQQAQQTNTSGLAVANPVDEARNTEITQGTAEEVDPERKLQEAKERRQREKVALLLIVLLFLVVILAIVLLVVFLAVLPDSGDSSATQSTSNQTKVEPQATSPPTLSIADQVLNLFPEYTVDTIQNDRDASSPQRRAYQWLLEDPYLLNYTDARKVQRFALATLFHATNPTSGVRGWDNSSGWLDYTVHECSWQFFWISPWLNTEMRYNINLTGPCFESDQDETAGDVYHHIGLPDNNLQGTIPEELYLLTGLKSILLDNNNELAGTLSTHIGELSSTLEFLSLGLLPKLSGSLPSELGRLTKVENLFLYRTQLTGSIPTELGLLKELERLGLFLTSINGTIPEELAPPKAKNIFLSFGQLSGTVPTGLVSLTELRRLILHGNSRLSGSIPSEIGLSRQLWQLTLYDCAFTGTLPEELGSLVANASLQHVNLTTNRFSGIVPPGLCLIETPAWQNRSAPPNVVIPSPVYLGHDCNENLCGCSCNCG